MEFDKLQKTEVKPEVGFFSFGAMTLEEIKERMKNPADPIHEKMQKIIKGILQSLLPSKGGRVHDPTLLENLTQDVFIKVWKKIDQFEERAGLTNWIYSIARNTLFDHFRKNKAQRIGVNISIDDLTGKDEVLALESTLSPTEQEIIENLDNQSFRSSLRSELTSQELDLIEMRFNQELTGKQIAEKLYTSESAIKKRFVKLFRKIAYLKIAYDNQKH